MLREFTDDDGVAWRVWDVNPSLHERMTPRPSRFRIKVPESWLCFESARERRRLTPIPERWENTDEGALKRLCARAERVKGRA